MGAPLLYSDPLPLRRASDLPQYRADAADRYLPWVFGRARVSPVPLDLAGAEWLVADHPVAGIDRVTVGGHPTQGWQLLQRLDTTGHPIAVLRLAQPAGAEAVAVSVAGRRHPQTGAELVTPSAIVRELLRLCGHTEPRDAWAGLDAVYGQTTLGLVIAEDMPLRQAVAAVVEPLGAMWRPGWATRRAPGQPVATLDASVVESITARAENTALRTTARVTYAYDWAAGAARGSMSLAAPQAVGLWGELPLDIDLPAVFLARDALAIASARLAAAARALWVVDATVSDRVGDLREGMTVLMDHAHAPAGLAVLTSVSLDREQGSYTLKAEMHAASAPRVDLVRRGAALVPAANDAQQITYRDGVATFTVLDENGQPMAGAAVTLDGLYTANTDASGQVQFRTERGAHTLTVRMPGYADFALEVVV
ncbi:carboxypeptidase-like regulatory domain-containing protein [Acidovorax sp. ACV01]|uniref:carboxypeptidase regulatory-like domain-containing protein n=1 Tax=Acidovorax sp. ACV01 TaxID=2769311 RepID=UPI001786AE56|nr:carboxypeptidase regulatory-like domain-containing protein [Acidovorax sp. ACV01]